MRTEIEAKLKVESHQRAAAKLAELGAEFLAEQVQTDHYFDDANRTLSAGDKCLRVRQMRTGGTEKIIVTYKGPKERHELKKREEIEIEVKDRGSVEKLLSALGYEEALVVEKKRRLWLLGECEVALDELSVLGSFIEIEGPDAKRVADIQKSLGLEHLHHIPESYASLVAERLQQDSHGQQQL